MKKIGILASSNNDPFVHTICQWVKKKGSLPVVIYEQDLFNNKNLILNITSNKIGLQITTIDDVYIDFDEISVFYRRSWHHEPIIIENEEDLFCKKEILALREYILFRIDKVNKLIGKCSLDSLIKVRHLDIANQVGFNIPKTIVTNNVRDLKPKTDSVLNKSINASYFKLKKKMMITNYTNKIKFDLLPTKFFPSMFQEEVNKKIELRIFVIFTRIFCVAYLDKSTSSEIDIRLKLAEQVMEPYPYLLPKEIQHKVIGMLALLGLETASIDLVVDTKNRYVFLDLNPFGQASMVSKSGFYQVEKEIAEILINF